MYISVIKLKKNAGVFEDYHFEYPLSFFDLEENGFFSTDLQAVYQKGNVYIRGNFAVSYEACCDRCLEPVQVVLNEEFSEEFTEIGSDGSGAVKQDQSEEFLRFSENELPLKEYFRQAIITSFPFSVLCSDNCKGLCPACGEAQGNNFCSCSQDNIDPRWAVLNKLKKKLPKK